MKRLFIVIFALLPWTGCSMPNVKRATNVPSLKQSQQQRNKNNSSEVKDQTGIDLGTATPVPGKRRNPLTSAPIE